MRTQIVILQKSLAAALATLILVGFQNCSPFKAAVTRSQVDISSVMESSVGEKLYTANCAACHGPIATSTKRNRSALMIQSAINQITSMSPLKSLSPIDIQAIASALSNSTPVVVKDGKQIFSCDPKLVSKSTILKLTRREYIASMNQLLDGFSTALKNDSSYLNLTAALPTDTALVDKRYVREQPLVLTNDMVSAYFDVAFRAGQLVASASTGLQNFAGTNQCLNQGTITQACHRLFVQELGRRTFRRPLTDAELTDAATRFWDASLSKADLITLTFTGMAQMPDYLYKIYDNGAPNATLAQTVDLNAFELANKIAFFITGQPADATLISLASSGALNSAATLNQQIDRLLALPSAQEFIKRFARETYGYEYFDTNSFPAVIVGDQNLTDLQPAMINEMDQYFVDAILNRSGTFKNMMTGRQSRITAPSLAQLYGRAGTGDVELGPERAGFLSRGAFLSKRKTFSTSPVKRGLLIMDAVLCEHVGAPPADAPTVVPPSIDPNRLYSTRERYDAAQTRPGTVCASCHTAINPPGYALEIFDPLGRVRSQEKIYDTQTSQLLGNVAVRPDAIVTTMGVTPVNVSGYSDMTDKLGDNDKAMMCFVTKLKRFESIKEASASDGCQMNEALKVLYGANGTQGTIKDALKAYITSTQFKQWSY